MKENRSWFNSRNNDVRVESYENLSGCKLSYESKPASWKWSFRLITFTSAVLQIHQQAVAHAESGSSGRLQFLLCIIVTIFRDTGRQPAQEHLDFFLKNTFFLLPSCENVRLCRCLTEGGTGRKSRAVSPHAFRWNSGSNLNAWICSILAASTHRALWNAAKCCRVFMGVWAGILGCSDALYKHLYLILPLNEIRFPTLTLACSNLSVSN